jgi:hypothetical protein
MNGGLIIPNENAKRIGFVSALAKRPYIGWRGVRLFVPQNNCGYIARWRNSAGSA